MHKTTNDNEAGRNVRRQPEPDAHGQSAMLLVESLIHGLVARSVISVAEAVEIVDVATEVALEIADDLGSTPDTMRQPISLLTGIGDSLRRDCTVKNEAGS